MRDACSFHLVTNVLAVRASRPVSLVRSSTLGGAHYHHHRVFPSQLFLQSGHAYRCFCSPDKLSATRERLARTGSNSTYDKACLHLAEEEVARRVRAGEKSIVRLNVCHRPSRRALFSIVLPRMTGSLNAFWHMTSSLGIYGMRMLLCQPTPSFSSPTCSLLTTLLLSSMTMRWASPTSSEERQVSLVLSSSLLTFHRNGFHLFRCTSTCILAFPSNRLNLPIFPYY